MHVVSKKYNLSLQSEVEEKYEVAQNQNTQYIYLVTLHRCLSKVLYYMDLISYYQCLFGTPGVE